MELFEQFPHIVNEKIIIKKMVEEDLDNLSEITNNENIYKYCPLFLFKKSKGNLLAAIRNLGGRDFDKKKCIIAGVYLCDNPDKLVGMAEIFDYKKRDHKITIGYKINETYWHQGIATNVVDLLTNYLSDQIGIGTIQAFVMPDNIHSSKALLKNGFTKEDYQIQVNNWCGQDIVDVEVYTYRKNE